MHKERPPLISLVYTREHFATLQKIRPFKNGSSSPLGILFSCKAYHMGKKWKTKNERLLFTLGKALLKAGSTQPPPCIGPPVTKQMLCNKSKLGGRRPWMLQSSGAYYYTCSLWWTHDSFWCVILGVIIMVEVLRKLNTDMAFIYWLWA
jgi:hypothetical protein